MSEEATRNKATVRAFFGALETEDPDAVADLFAEDGVHRNPYHSGVFPAGAEGRDAIRAYWAPTFPNFDGMRFELHEVLATEDPRLVFVRFGGIITLKGGTGTYENDYYATFRFDEGGQIVEYVEIFNPVVAARGFGLMGELVQS